MGRAEILAAAEEQFGSVPEWLSGMPDAVLEQYWTTLGWLMTETAMSTRDKVLVAFGAAAAIHCQY